VARELEEVAMEAHQGDRITVESNRVGGGTRHGEVVEVIPGATGVTHYRVRWDDGRETTFFPSSDSHVTRS
jgi:transcription elongation factor